MHLSTTEKALLNSVTRAFEVDEVLVPRRWAALFEISLERDVDFAFDDVVSDVRRASKHRPIKARRVAGRSPAFLTISPSDFHGTTDLDCHRVEWP